MGNHRKLIADVRRELFAEDCAVVGFDFPIGVPQSFAAIHAVTNFKALLLELGRGDWTRFYDVATNPDEISSRRPFYPNAPGNKKQAHLLNGLGMQSINDLRRRCEEKYEGRRAACPLFWTLGANQAGKGAITGWRDVISPAIRDDRDVVLWPFDGDLAELMRPRKIVIAETYPAEFYGWLFSAPLMGKGKVGVRKTAGSELVRWAERNSVLLTDELRQQIENGFPEGDDAFDAVVGLLGMVEVVSGRRSASEPRNRKTRNVEGWILGQKAGADVP
ncbi:MAG TPA: hypothetical protein VFO34_09290 [Candidatus Acidoferrales bacterium]|nr:hypothetical protein [Candidatus Acidoferrales bacterium]